MDKESDTPEDRVDETCLLALSLGGRNATRRHYFPGLISPTCCRGHPPIRIRHHHPSSVPRGETLLGGRNVPPPVNFLALTGLHAIVGAGPIHLRTGNPSFEDILMHRTGLKDQCDTKACVG